MLCEGTSAQDLTPRMEVNPLGPKNQQNQKRQRLRGQTDVHSEMFQIPTLLQYPMINKKRDTLW